ncbi:hypothetical protein DSM05_02545 [Pseudomonas sp. FW305-3-2-15-E-TSA4]|nr:hypothetical protein [Pseudomonas sp. FW305-3-2-15-E-TSA4]
MMRDTGEDFLGPVRTRLERRLFEADFGWEPELIVTQHQILDGAFRPLNIGILPTPWRIEGLRFWRFVISGLIFDLKLDDQPLQKSADLWPVNGRENAIVWVEGPILATEIPGLVESFLRMAGPSLGSAHH